MDKATVAFVVGLALLCGAFGVVFRMHQWPTEVDGYDFPPETAVALAEGPSPRYSGRP
jgi:hypothetical protein